MGDAGEDINVRGPGFALRALAKMLLRRGESIRSMIGTHELSLEPIPVGERATLSSACEAIVIASDELEACAYRLAAKKAGL